MNRTSIRPNTIKLLEKFIRPLTDAGLITIPEEKTILANLRHLMQNGELIPPIMPKLIDQNEAAEILGVSLANFKKLEREGSLPFKRKKLGGAVRYRNLDVISYVMSASDDTEELSS